MYSPVLSESMVKTLYRLKQMQGKPMTVIVEKSAFIVHCFRR